MTATRASEGALAIALETTESAVSARRFASEVFTSPKRSAPYVSPTLPGRLALAPGM
jgi:hypothetical protein